MEKNVVGSASLFSSLRYFMSLFSIGLRSFQLFFFCKSSFLKRLDLIRSNTVCNGSTERNAGHLGAFSTLDWILETFAYTLSTAYLRWTSSALFPEKFVLQILCSTFFLASRAGSKIWSLRRSDRSFEKLCTAKSTP